MLFTTDYTLELTEAERNVVLRDIVGDGGHQRLLRHLVKNMNTFGVLKVDDATLQKVHRYADSYGGGGFQERFKAIRAAAWRAGWVQP